MFRLLRTSVVIVGVLVSGSAFAQGSFYMGGGIGYAMAESEPSSSGGPASSGDLGMIGVTAGYRHDFPANFAAAELDADFNLTGEMERNGLSCDDGFAQAPYFCEHDATVRLRGLFGADVGAGYEVFGSAGFAMMFGQGAIGPGGNTDGGSVTGYTVGLGAQRALGAGTGRVEVIYDKLDNIRDEPDGIYEPTWQATTIKASYLFSF